MTFCHKISIIKACQTIPIELRKPEWVPESEFLDETNREAIASILGAIAASSANEQFIPQIKQATREIEGGEDPSNETRRWMWRGLMGAQHGTVEGANGKVVIDNYSEILPHLNKLHYGNLNFTEGNAADPTKEYGVSLVLGGSAEELPRHLQAARGKDPRDIHVHDTYLLVGQRQRWSALPDEKDPKAIMEAIASPLKGLDMDKIIEKSPWLREELKKKTEAGNWHEAFATEYEIGKLASMAYSHDLIDWNHEAEELLANDQTSTPGAPDRHSVLTTYHLTDGTRAHLLNAAAAPRAQGVPRPTSDSQIKELLSLNVLEKEAKYPLSISVSPPHYRAAIDLAIRLLQTTSLSSLEIATPVAHDRRFKNSPDYGLRALGEIPATYKAHERIKAILNGEDPDSEELLSL